MSGSLRFVAGRPLKSQVIIRRPQNIKIHPRAHNAEDDALAASNAQASGSSMTLDESVVPTFHQGTASDDPPDEMARIRTLLRPPPIPGVEDWGIPPPSTEPCDPTIEVIFHSYALFHMTA